MSKFLWLKLSRVKFSRTYNFAFCVNCENLTSRIFRYSVSSCSNTMDEYCVPFYIHGHHVYYKIWSPVIGERLLCEREPGNRYNNYTVAVKKNTTIVGNLPRKISKMSSLFLRKGGEIEFVSGSRRHSVI